ncbi:MAG: hypothetical protein DMG26_19385, partial [Acidobacteria bacterium]
MRFDSVTNLFQPAAQARRPQAERAGFSCRSHFALESARVLRGQVRDDLDIHIQSLGATPELLRVLAFERIEAGLHASGAETMTVLEELVCGFRAAIA